MLIGNGRYYGGRLEFFPDARIDDGLLDVLVFQKSSYFDIARYFGTILMKRHSALEDMDYFQTRTLRVSSEEAVPVEVDGELTAELPVSFRVAPRKLRVLVPAAHSADLAANAGTRKPSRGWRVRRVARLYRRGEQRRAGVRLPSAERRLQSDYPIPARAFSFPFPRPGRPSSAAQPDPMPFTAEDTRLQEDADRRVNWKRWGPYLSERQWGSVREDYSADGDAWNYFPHEHGPRPRLPLGRGWPARHQRSRVPALLCARALEWARPHPEGAHLRPEQSAGKSRRGCQGVVVLPRFHADPFLPQGTL